MTPVWIAIGAVGLLFGVIFIFAMCRAAANGDDELHERHEREKWGRD